MTREEAIPFYQRMQRLGVASMKLHPEGSVPWCHARDCRDEARRQLTLHNARPA